MSATRKWIEAGMNRLRLGRLLRWAAWAALIGAAGVVVRAEVMRPELPQGVEAYTDIVYRRIGTRRERVDVYVPLLPAPAGGRPAVLAIHGGGWRGGSKNGYGREVAQLAKYGYVVIAPTYLHSRESAPSWPENLEDLREAVRWVRRHASDYGINPRRIAAMGASAGGHLAALLGALPDQRGEGQARTPESEQNEVSARVGAAIVFYGPADLRSNYRASPAAARAISMLLGGTPEELPKQYDQASPLRFISPDDPPMLVVHGQLDKLVPLDQSRALDAALEAAGVPHQLVVVNGARHGFGLHADKTDLTPVILDFLDHVWKD
ncbi:MAG TPA: alpha/beta hydrolase [Isosphaeraceae bacterium]|nr:alpha/beta hydrolase [Isosphaeraceae bacterium]